MTVRYRLGLDLGTNSIGWAAVGARRRRAPRTAPGWRRAHHYGRMMRLDEIPSRRRRWQPGDVPRGRCGRRRDRFLRRQKRLMEILTANGLMPADTAARKELEKLDPYWLRARALAEPLTLHEIGRALFHLNQRRGFSSNRITDADDAEGGAMKQGMAQLQEALEQAGGAHARRVPRQAAPPRPRGLSGSTRQASGSARRTAMIARRRKG